MGCMSPTRLQQLLRVQPATRYPADPRAVFVLGFAIAVGIPLVVARIAPGSIADVMPLWGVVAWAWGLVIGSCVTLIGMTRQTTTGIIIEQIGSVIVGVVTIIYGACTVLVVGPGAGVAAGIIVGFGLSCFYRWFQLDALLRASQIVVDKVRSGQAEVDAQDFEDIMAARAERHNHPPEE